MVLQGLRAAWVTGKHITIDESMIKYKGKYVGFVQYMRDKPIKHGLKVFSCNCSYTAVLRAAFVYLGKYDSQYTRSINCYLCYSRPSCLLCSSTQAKITQRKGTGQR